MRLSLHERIDVAESLVPVLQEIFDGLSEKRLQVAVESLIE